MSRYIEQKSTCKSIVECRLSALGGSIESVNKLIEFYESHSFLAGLGYGLELAFDIIGKQPTADVVEVVRCKDCVLHNKCITEDVFKIAGKTDGFCCVGKKVE